MTQPDPLARVRRAAKAKRRAENEYRMSLAAALEAGRSYAEIARTVGISRQAVRQLVCRATLSDQP